MFGSTYGTIFKVMTWGESHGKGIGVVVDGCPAGLLLCEDDIQRFLDLRKPGQHKFTTARKESDSVQILSGVYNGKTTGTPISMMIQNENQRSQDYKEIDGYYRPGHADYTFDEKFGFRDPRGGGRSSGRETIGRVAAGAIASKILNTLGISLLSYTYSIGPISISKENFDQKEIEKNVLKMPDASAAKKATQHLEECIKNQDSCGGVIACEIYGCPTGIGEPVFEKLDANFAKALMSIGAVKSVEVGSGLSSSTLSGSQNNDEFYYDEEKNIHKSSNHSGGILGGISDGSPILLRVGIKPTPSISSTQNTVNKSGENISINIHGRHDPIIVPRAVIVVESMVALTLLDLLLGSMTSRLDGIIQFFSNKK